MGRCSFHLQALPGQAVHPESHFNPAVGDTSLSAVTIVWNYVGELVFNLLVLVGAVKASDRIVKEMMGL